MGVPPRWRRDLEEADRAMRRAGTPARAESERSYLKSELTFYGAGIPAIRGVEREIRRRHRDATHDEIIEVVRELFRRPVHEHRTLATLLLVSFRDRLGARDLPFVEGLVRTGAWWNFVDEIGVHVVGVVAVEDPRALRTLGRWSRDRDLWVRRAALLGLLPGLKSGQIEFVEFERLAVPRLEEREFFMRKAIGWILREVGKRRPVPVAAFLHRHRDRIAPLTFREAIKYLPPGDRRRLLGGRPASSSKGRR